MADLSKVGGDFDDGAAGINVLPRVVFLRKPIELRKKTMQTRNDFTSTYYSNPMFLLVHCIDIPKFDLICLIRRESEVLTVVWIRDLCLRNT